MQKRLLILAVVALALTGGAVFVWQKKNSQVVDRNLEPVQENTQDGSKNDVFITDVDPDVSHWKTRETKNMVFKFPKEWFWIEILVEKPGANGAFVISNNPDFPLENYKNDSISMTGIQNLVLGNTEVVITVWGTATSNSGTPLDSLDFLTTTKEDDPTRVCIRPSDVQTLPLVASCSIKQENRQMAQVYYIIDEINSLILTARTSDNTLVSKDILEKIARSIKIKY